MKKIKLNALIIETLEPAPKCSFDDIKNKKLIELFKCFVILFELLRSPTKAKCLLVEKLYWGEFEYARSERIQISNDRIAKTFERDNWDLNIEDPSLIDQLFDFSLPLTRFNDKVHLISHLSEHANVLKKLNYRTPNRDKAYKWFRDYVKYVGLREKITGNCDFNFWINVLTNVLPSGDESLIFSITGGNTIHYFPYSYIGRPGTSYGAHTLISNGDYCIYSPKMILPNDKIMITTNPEVANQNSDNVEGVKWISSIPGVNPDFKQFQLDQHEVTIFVNNCNSSIEDDINNKIDLYHDLQKLGVDANFLLAITKYEERTFDIDYVYTKKYSDTIIKDSVKFLTLDELNTLKTELAECRDRKNTLLTGKVDVYLDSTLSSSTVNGDNLIYPLLIEGSSCMILARENTGKTPFMFYMASRFVAGKHLFTDSLVARIPKNMKAIDRKAMILLFEGNTTREIEHQVKTIVEPQLENKKAMRDNLKIQPITENILTLESRSEIMKLVKDFEPHIVLIDTASAAMGGRAESSERKKLNIFINELTASGYGVILSEHLNYQGNAMGGVKDLASPHSILELTCEDDKKAIGEVTTVKIKKLRDPVQGAFSPDGFEMKFDQTKAQYVTNSEPVKDQCKKVVNALKGITSVEDIAPLIGMSKSTLYGNLKK